MLTFEFLLQLNKLGTKLMISFALVNLVNGLFEQFLQIPKNKQFQSHKEITYSWTIIEPECAKMEISFELYVLDVKNFSYK
jgi:hypothetical protein